MSVQLQELRGFVSDMYSDVARFPRAEFHFPIGRPIMERLGYAAELLDRIEPVELVDAWHALEYIAAGGATARES